MTVPNTNTRNGPFYPNGSTTIFPFTFRALSDDDVEVVRVSADGTVTALSSALYNVSLTSNGGSAVFSAPPAAGDPLYVQLSPSFMQGISLENEGAFLPEVLTEALDRGTQQSLWLRDLLKRAITVPFGNVAPRLPLLADLAGKALGGAADGSAFVPVALGGADAALRGDLANPSAGGLIVRANNGPQAVAATVTDTLRWVSRGDARTFGLGSATLDVVVSRAYTAGVRSLFIPEGTWNTDNFIAVGDMEIFGAGRGKTIVNGPTSAAVFAYVGGVGSTISDLTVIANNSGGGGAAITSYLSTVKLSSAALLRTDIYMRGNVVTNAVRIAPSAGGSVSQGVDGFLMEDVYVDKPRRMGAEFLAQDGTGRVAFTGLVINRFTCNNPSWLPGYAPAISIDGLIVRARVSNVRLIDTTGGPLEIIEAPFCVVDGVDFVRPLGDLVQITNTRTVQSPELRRFRKVEQAGGGVPVNTLTIGSSADAIIADCDLPLTILLNSIAPRTRLLRNSMSSDGNFVIYNGGGSGGGAGMVIEGGSYDLATSSTAQATLFFDPNTGQSVVNGARLRAGNKPDGTQAPYIGGSGASGIVAGQNFLTNRGGTATIVGTGL